jgi:hypothetical protein
MKQQHPITPPPELVQQWASESLATQNLCNRAAQWGADQELEATLAEVSFLNSQALADRVRAARRHKPPSLKDRALKGLAKMIENGHLAPDLADEIRAVVEMAPDE